MTGSGPDACLSLDEEQENTIKTIRAKQLLRSIIFSFYNHLLKINLYALFF